MIREQSAGGGDRVGKPRASGDDPYVPADWDFGDW